VFAREQAIVLVGCSVGRLVGNPVELVCSAGWLVGNLASLGCSADRLVGSPTSLGCSVDRLVVSPTPMGRSVVFVLARQASWLGGPSLGSLLVLHTEPLGRWVGWLVGCLLEAFGPSLGTLSSSTRHGASSGRRRSNSKQRDTSK
jgi:hypothetical protein